jgi:hypothetical protein
VDNPKASRGSGRIIFTSQRHDCLEQINLYDLFT